MTTAKATRPYLVTLGETMALFHSSRPGPLENAQLVDLSIGGSESNVAIGVSRLGGSSVWLGRIGDDALGRLVRRQIRAEGVDARVTVDPDASTGLMVKERRTSNSQNVDYYRRGSAGSRLTPDLLDPELIQNAAVLHISGITPALSPSAASTVDAAIELAHDARVPVSLDLNYRAKLWDAQVASESYRRLAHRCTVLFGGHEEIAMVTGHHEDPMVMARKAAALGPAEVIVKLGAEGAVAVIDGSEYIQPAIPITPEDTVGAGDAFVAGYLADRMAGRSAEARLVTAAQTGAFACLTAGDWEGLPRRRELALLAAGDPVQR